MTLALDKSDLRTVLPLKDAIAATHTGSRWSFYRWCAAWRVKPFRHGQYVRAELAEGMAREEAARNRRK